MTETLAKKFEQKVKEDFLCVPGATIDRLYDQVSGKFGIRNICDFIGYIFPNIFYLEVKTHKGGTFPLTNLTQYDALNDKFEQKVKGVRIGVIIWFYEKDTVCYVPFDSIRKMKADGKKSVNIKYLQTEEYPIVPIKSAKKRKFMDSDYSVLTTLSDNQ